MICKLMLLLTLTAGTITGFAQQSYNDQVMDYIAKYKDMAVEEQRRSGVPASITLAQGILETSAGQSELCNNASNHFGIKCKNTWTGETYTYTDDAKDECFRKYDCAKTSYADHSDFLKNNKRYGNLFSLSPTDYAAWAYGLKRCGYATNPQYAQKLIKFIEDYKLQQYTYAALDNNGEEILYAAAQPKAIYKTTNIAAVIPGENIPRNDANYTAASTFNGQAEIYVEKAAPQEEKNAVAKDYYVVTTKNGIKGFYARRGDILLEYAIKNKIRYAKLLEFNDLSDAPLEADMFIYLSKKPKTANTFTHTVAAGETMLQISQEEGIQLGELLALNHLSQGQEAVPGSVLNLQTPSDKIPETYVNNSANNNNTPTQPVVQLSNDAGFVPAGKPVEINDSDNETVTDLSRNQTNEAPVNIANEQPVEEEIVETRPANRQPQTAPKNQTALDKLKAHMDKVVYTQTEFEPKSSGDYNSEDSDEETVTTNTAKSKNTKTVAKENKSKTTPKAVVKPKVHTVKRGETLFAIADKYGMTVKELQKLNKLKSSTIKPGAKLKVSK
jgi:LysM repeat protein